MNQNIEEQQRKQEERGSFIEDAIDVVSETASSLGDGVISLGEGAVEIAGGIVGGIFEGLGSL